jgi:hypothetical protein
MSGVRGFHLSVPADEATAVSVPGRFNGPLASGNGGYASGVIAGIPGDAAEVSLRRPVPR